MKLHHDEIYIGLRGFCSLTWSVSTNFTIAVKSVQYIEEYLDMGFGFDDDDKNDNIIESYFCYFPELFGPESDFFVNGIMEIELSGKMQSRGIKRKTQETTYSLAKRLWKSNDKDVTILVDNKEFKIHKWVLSDKSPVFEAEMNSGFKEAQENKITVPDFSFDTVKIFIEYCYERNIIDLINQENASELLKFSDKYDIAQLSYQIQSFLIEKISETNVCKFANLSVTTNAKNLRECCVCFLMKYVLKSTVINDIEKLDPEIFKEIGQRCFPQTSK